MQIRPLIVALALAVALAGCGHKGSPTEGGQVGHGPAPAAPSTAPAPDAQLTRATGEKIALADLLHQHAQTVVVFYRGFY